MIPFLDRRPANEYLKRGGQYEYRKETRMQDVKTELGVVLRNTQTIDVWHSLDSDAWYLSVWTRLCCLSTAL